MTLKKFKTKQEVALYFSRYLAIVISSRNEVHIALSGGSTPKIVFDELASNFQEDIDWSEVHLYWGDERCVPPDDAQSNYRMTVTHLLSKIDIPEANIHRIHGERDPSDEADRYATLLTDRLPVKNGIPRFDMVILGMGDDGHTASIFPHEIELWHSARLCEVATHPEIDQKRITLTGQMINNADLITFLVTGKGKADKVKEIIGREEGAEHYPASLVAPTHGKLLWFLDEEAASSLNED